MAQRRRIGLLGGGLVAVVALVVIVLVVVRLRGDDAAPLDAEHPATLALESFADGWSTGELADVDFAPGDEKAADLIALITGALDVHEAGPSVELTSVEPIEDQNDRVRGRFSVGWDLGDDRIWTYEVTATVVEIEDEWLVEYSPTSVEPSLRSGEVIRARSVPGRRGRVRSTAGEILSPGDSTVVVTIRKGRADDPEETARRVAELTSVPLAPLLREVEAAGPDDSIEVVRLPRGEYDPIRDDLQPLSGVFFEEITEESDVDRDFAPSVIGRVGPADDDLVEASEGTIRPGDRVGLSGLQRSQEERLAGRPGLVVEAIGSEGARPLETFEGTDGEDITITIDRRIQQIADEVTAGREDPAALVAVRVSTGEILAIGNGGDGYDRALLGRYAPGSTFKIASAYAVLADTDLDIDSIVPCPATETIGRTFRNADDAVYGDIPFRTAFAKSCNTSFVGLSRDVDANQLARAAALLGYGQHDIGLPMFGASVPTDGDATEHAAQMIGQGRVEGTVLDVAMLSASIASGQPLGPTLIVDHATDTVESERIELDQLAVEGVREMMRSAVTGGTATVLVDVPGGEVHAKTGTAQFGSADPPETHAWMTGYQDDIAFAVVVEGGGGGAAVAGPIAADFLTRLAAL